MTHKEQFFREMMKDEFPDAGLIMTLWQRFFYQFVYFFHKQEIEEIIFQQRTGSSPTKTDHLPDRPLNPKRE